MNLSMLYKGIVISGPTGVGKTALSIKLAKKLNMEIISADASQVYREMNIGTAKITEKEMEGIRHYLIDVVNPSQDYTVGNFEKDVNKILNEKNGKNIMLVGGTGLYIRSITDGFSKLPEKNEKIRNELEKKSLQELQEMLKSLDRASYENIDLCNKLRFIRAIEVCILTNGKFSELREKNVKDNDYKFLKIFLTRNREELYDRINKRVEIMVNEGLEKETRQIYEKYKDCLYKISSIGYKEMFKYFDGEWTFENAIEEIKKESRRYAKRQITWFKKEKDYIIYNLSEMNENEIILNILEEFKNF